LLQPEVRNTTVSN